MPKFALKYPFFIIMLCLVVALVGAVNVARMPVDLFPNIDVYKRQFRCWSSAN